MRWVARSAVQLAVRAATAGTVAVAQGLGMPQPIYAMISGVIVTDLDPSKSRGLAFPRILGTVIGLAHVLHNPEAAKLAGYVCAVVMLSHVGDAWSYAWWRCVDTMIGIVAAVAMSFVPKLLHDQPPQ